MHADISAVASLIGDPARARILSALMGGFALPAGELAITANIAPQTASAHLSKLLQGNLLSAETQGRHRYYRLASPEIGTVIEALASIAPLKKAQAAPETERSNPLRFARTCYNHLAGTVAVQINEALLASGVLAPGLEKQYQVTAKGRVWFCELGIDIEAVEDSRSICARKCLDWTERRHHLAGALGTALLQRFLELRWVARMERTRAVRITHVGQEQLRRLLGIEFKRF